MVGRFRIPILSAMICAAITAIAGIGRSIETAIDRFVRFAFQVTKPGPIFAFDGAPGSLIPQPGEHQISASLWHRNRHEAHSHARAADRAI